MTCALPNQYKATFCTAKVYYMYIVNLDLYKPCEPPMVHNVARTIEVVHNIGFTNLDKWTDRQMVPCYVVDFVVSGAKAQSELKNNVL